MEGHEITHLIKVSGHKVKQIAESLDVSQPTVTQVIYRIRNTKRIREAISKATGKAESELWPDNQSGAQEAA